MMSTLSHAAFALGGVLILKSLALLLAPATIRRCISAFPRNAWMGRILTAIALAWSAWLVYQMPLGRFDLYKPALYVITPAILVLAVYFIDELLAARALGGLLLLVPNLLLDASFGHPSGLKLVVVILSYIMVIIGLILVINPFRFRRLLRPVTEGSDTKSRMIAIGGIALGAVLILLSIFAY